MRYKGVELWRRLALISSFKSPTVLVLSMSVPLLLRTLHLSCLVVLVWRAYLPPLLWNILILLSGHMKLLLLLKQEKGVYVQIGKSPERSRGDDRSRVALSLCMCRVNLRGNINIRAVCSVCHVTCDISPYYNIGELF